MIEHYLTSSSFPGAAVQPRHGQGHSGRGDYRDAAAVLGEGRVPARQAECELGGDDGDGGRPGL